MPYDPDKHHRRSIRLADYDYRSDGMYSVTLCVHDRSCLFGQIRDEKMRLNQYGRVIEQKWRWLAKRYPYVGLDAWVIMPNHIHGIIVMIDQGGSRTAPTMSPQRKPLGRLIGAFKTVSAKEINLMRKTPTAPVWQRDFYEHIIRTEQSLNEIRQYIQTNPARWQYDKLYVDGS